MGGCASPHPRQLALPQACGGAGRSGRAIRRSSALIAVARAGGTLIHDLETKRLVRHDREAGVHERADRYGGPACSPDGRFVAVPDTFAKAVFFFRLSDGARVAALTFDRDGDAPGFVTWPASPERAVSVRLVPDPTGVNPPK